MRQSTEISIDLTAQELLDLPADANLTEIDDICALDLPAGIASTEVQSAAIPAGDPCTAQSAEVEVEIDLTLTPAEMDAMLKGEW